MTLPVFLPVELEGEEKEVIWPIIFLNASGILYGLTILKTVTGLWLHADYYMLVDCDSLYVEISAVRLDYTYFCDH